jgi:hypothetical protein
MGQVIFFPPYFLLCIYYSPPFCLLSQNLNFFFLTNAFSKKLENHCYAIALHFVYYNFGKIHKTLRATPAMEAGLCKDLMGIEEIVGLAD